MSADTQTNPTTGINDVATTKRFPKGIYKGTREEWLEEAMQIMGEWINSFLESRDEASRHLLQAPSQLRQMVDKWGHKPSYYKFNGKNIKVSCSLQGSGLQKAGSLAHIHYAHATGNNMHEIRMSVEMGGRKTKADSSRVADVLLHEMIHSCAKFHGHKGPFKHIAQGVGLTGKMTQTVASDDLKARIKSQVIDILGKYPHKEVKLVPRGQRGKGSRMIKCECKNCGCIIRLSRKWIDEADGFIICPIGGDNFQMDVSA